MKITSVEPQKRKGRYNVFVDGAFWCGLSENTLAKFFVYPDKVVDSEILDDIFKFEIFNKTFEASIGKIARRPHSEWEISKYVDEKFWKNRRKWFKDTQYDKEFEQIRDRTKSDILKKLRKLGYLDDKEFSKWWIESRKSARPRGWIAIKSELLSKGVSEELINDLRFSNNEEEKLAQKYYEKVVRTKSLNRDKIISRLGSKGFSWDTVQSILKRNEVEN
ncbi:MAG: RecX family transcriptional regulator [bacterium]